MELKWIAYQEIIKFWNDIDKLKLDDIDTKRFKIYVFNNCCNKHILSESEKELVYQKLLEKGMIAR